MFTNLKSFGGNFREVLDSEFAKATSVTIASGYTSLDVINAYTPEFIRIAKSGGTSRLLIGMAFYEGLSEKKYNAAMELNSTLGKLNDNSGVYLTNGRRYHGKVYHFQKDSQSIVYVGSSNFSTSGTKTNIECTLPIKTSEQKVEILKFIKELYSPDYSIKIDKAGDIISSKRKSAFSTVQNQWDKLQKYDPKSISKNNLPKLVLSLTRIVDKPMSNLNVYFGKGRENKKTGVIKPRPWYEVELIANRDLNSKDDYPKGDFIAYTDDGYIIPMRTSGTNYKNIRSKKSLQILGMWLKSKLEKSGALKKYEAVTRETLIEYGKDEIEFYKIKEGKYYMEF